MTVNFRKMLQENSKVTVENNTEINKLQSQFERFIYSNESIAQSLKLAVKWLRDNPDKTASKAIEKFFQN